MVQRIELLHDLQIDALIVAVGVAINNLIASHGDLLIQPLIYPGGKLAKSLLGLANGATSPSIVHFVVDAGEVTGVYIQVFELLLKLNGPGRQCTFTVAEGTTIEDHIAVGFERSGDGLQPFAFHPIPLRRFFGQESKSTAGENLFRLSNWTGTLKCLSKLNVVDVCSLSDGSGFSTKSPVRPFANTGVHEWRRNPANLGRGKLTATEGFFALGENLLGQKGTERRDGPDAGLLLQCSNLAHPRCLSNLRCVGQNIQRGSDWMFGDFTPAFRSFSNIADRRYAGYKSSNRKRPESIPWVHACGSVSRVCSVGAMPTSKGIGSGLGTSDQFLIEHVATVRNQH